MNVNLLSLWALAPQGHGSPVSSVREFVERRLELPVAHRAGVFPLLDASRQGRDALRILRVADFQQRTLLVRRAQSRADSGFRAATLVVDVGDDRADNIELSVEVVPFRVALREFAL